jgi:Fic family protein
MVMLKLEQFKSGTWRQQLKYKSFQPEFINHGWSWDDPKVNTLLEDATRALGELNALTLIVPDVDLYIRMHVIKEASQSSRIEGTQTRIDEAVMPQQWVDPERRDDWQEVQNYVEAMNHALEQLKTLPLSGRLFRQIHKILLQGVRGKNKLPGEFRKSQNWIGGSNLNNAVYIPPHHETVPELMNDLEKFLHNQSIEVPHLIRIAIAHYQFETIHPFLDGNGRIGRLIIPLYLVSKGLLRKPSFYLSDFFEQNRSAYYDGLSIARESNDMLHWIKFFLNGVIDISKKGIGVFQNLLKLISDCEAQLVNLGRRAENGRKLLLYLYSNPIITVAEIQALLKMDHKPANNLIKAFNTLGILKQSPKRKRNRLFYFEEYLNLFNVT